MSYLEAKGLCKTFGGVRAVDGFSFEADRHETIGIIGPNGAGKTTVFNLLTNIYPIDSGTVTLEGETVSGLEQHETTRKGIARTFQNIRLFSGLNVLQNVMTAADPYSQYGLASLFSFSRAWRDREKEVREKSYEFLKIVGIEKYASERPESLPYGLQRKLEIARALATGPRVLLLDEPAAGLNPTEVQEFIGLVRTLQEKFKFCTVIIEHRMEVIMKLSSRIYVLNFGKLLAHGTPSEINRDPRVLEAYIGKGGECLCSE
jgi:branched-chain amino acid transport system ATP-binding protein